MENHLFYGLFLWTPTNDICQKDKLISLWYEQTVSAQTEPSLQLSLAACPITN